MTVFQSMLKMPNTMLVVAMDKDEKPLWAMQLIPREMRLDHEYRDAPVLTLEGYITGDVQDYTL
jgi:hypothetical protein